MRLPPRRWIVWGGVAAILLAGFLGRHKIVGAYRLTRIFASWFEPTDPFRIAGPIYYVGTEGLGAYLIVSDGEMLLLDGAMPRSARHVEASIRALGFDPAKIDKLIISHAHVDHAGTLAFFKTLTGGKAEVAVMDRDVDVIEHGGKTDPQFHGWGFLHFEPVKVDRVLHDGETVTVGKVTLTARLSAGHTAGCTTWVTEIEVDGTPYTIAFVGSTHLNPFVRLVKSPTYPGIKDDFCKTLAMLDTLHPDIWLGAHTHRFGFGPKRAAMATKKAEAWNDYYGYLHYLAAERHEFESEVRNERGRASAAEPVCPR